MNTRSALVLVVITAGLLLAGIGPITDQPADDDGSGSAGRGYLTIQPRPANLSNTSSYRLKKVVVHVNVKDPQYVPVENATLCFYDADRDVIATHDLGTIGASATKKITPETEQPPHYIIAYHPNFTRINDFSLDGAEWLPDRSGYKIGSPSRLSIPYPPDGDPGECPE